MTPDEITAATVAILAELALDGYRDREPLTPEERTALLDRLDALTKEV